MEEEVISFSFRTNLSFKKRARAKSGESVFLIVGKYHLWYLTLTRTLVVVKEKEIARGARAFFARGKAGALFSSGFFFPAKHRIKLVTLWFWKKIKKETPTNNGRRRRVNPDDDDEPLSSGDSFRERFEQQRRLSTTRKRERKFWDKRVGQLHVRRGDFIAAGDKKIANVATRG